MPTMTTVKSQPQSSALQRAADYIDSFHGLSACSDMEQSNEAVTDLEVWRLRSLVVVAWSTGFSGATLVPLYLSVEKAVFLGTVLGTGSTILLFTPWLYRRKIVTRDGASRIIAGCAVLVMTILTVGSGGFPMGLAPGIQRILTILVLCFGSLRLGAAVTFYVMTETIILYMIGPINAALDDPHVLNLIMVGSWVMQPALLLLVGISLHVAGLQTVEKLRAVSEAKTRFLSVVSHELRTPLHGILGTCDLVLSSECVSNVDVKTSLPCCGGENSHHHESEGCSPSSFLDAIRSCQFSANHLLSLVEDLLLYSSSSSIRIQSKPLCVAQIFRTASATLSPMTANTSCSLEFVVTPEMEDMWFLGDALRLRQCFINVVGNAIKFCQRDCDKVTLRLDELSPPEGDSDDLWTLVFAVQDTGPGIPPEDLERIFAPFEQSSGPVLRSLAGVGLGLSIVVELLHKMNGGIHVKSTLGEGATFFLTLKLPRTKKPPEAASSMNGHSPSPKGSKPVRSPNRNSKPTTQLLSNGAASEGSSPHKTQVRSKKQKHSGPRNGESKKPTSVEPILIATIDEKTLDCLEKWNGEENLFTSRSHFDTWGELVESIRDRSTEADVIFMGESPDALRAARLLRGWIQELSAPAVPIVRVCSLASQQAEDQNQIFDAIVHPQTIPALARSWYRAMYLGAWILIVDDVELNRKILKTQLTRLGHRVTEAANGEEAVLAAEASGFAFDMIAMDVMMPVMDGQTAAMEISKSERSVRGETSRLCPIFALSAGANGIVDDMSAFSGFLQKPTRIDQLRGMVRYQIIRRLLPTSSPAALAVKPTKPRV